MCIRQSFTVVLIVLACFTVNPNVCDGQQYESFGASVLVSVSASISKDTTMMDDLQERIQQCLSHYSSQHEDVDQRRPWDLMHAALAFGKQAEFTVDHNAENGVAWLCANGAGQNKRLLQSAGEEIIPLFGPGYEGHQGQLLSILAQCDVPIEQEMTVGEETFTVENLVAYEKRTCRPGTELTFKLIGFSRYLEPGETWTNVFGEWSIERIVQEELDQPIQGASCGGTHRLNGLSHAILSRYYQGQPLDHGVWKRAEDKVKRYAKQAIKTQLADGRFDSLQFNHVRVYEHDLNRRLWISGHTLEWLVYFLPEQDLADPRFLKAVNHVTNLLLDNRDYDWEIGKKYHALHALSIFHQRVFNPSRAPSETQSESDDAQLALRPATGDEGTARSR